MISAFGVDHGHISKVFGGSILGAGSKLSHEVGAGGMSAKKLATGRMPQHGRISAVNYKASRGHAKKFGQQAASNFRQAGHPKDFKGYANDHPALRPANVGWQARADSVAAIAKPAGKTPVGMKGPIQNRVKTKKMRDLDAMF